MSSDEQPSPQGDAAPAPGSSLNATTGSWGKKVVGACTVITAILSVLALGIQRIGVI